MAQQVAERRRDPASRDAYCEFVRDLLLRYGAIRDVAIWNEPNKRLFWNPQVAADGTSLAPAEYEALLARCYDILHQAVPTVRVLGLALSSTGYDDAGSTRRACSSEGRGGVPRERAQRALLDTVGHLRTSGTAGERPWLKHVGPRRSARATGTS